MISNSGWVSSLKVEGRRSESQKYLSAGLKSSFFECTNCAVHASHNHEAGNYTPELAWNPQMSCR